MRHSRHLLCLITLRPYMPLEPRYPQMHAALHGCMRRNAFTCAGIRMRRNACGACVNEPVQCLSTRVHPGKQNKPLLKEFVRLRGRVDQLRFYYVCLGGLVWVCWSAAAGMHLEDGLLRPECMQRLCVPSQEGTT